jgi:tryptophan-rich sensory protein
MVETSKAVGGLLVVAGLVLAVISALTVGDGDSWSPTSLIPAIWGVLFLAIGFVSEKKPDLNKHLMHAGAVVALLGILGAFMPLFGGGLKTVSGLVMLAGCIYFLVRAIQSFKAARLAREAAERAVA